MNQEIGKPQKRYVVIPLVNPIKETPDSPPVPVIVPERVPMPERVS